ncbi:MAG: hypothetical protein LQ352_007656 [Teloschistes flavicans]|nr:MAG: hypothetical protein LQ352_007656 [Teloschistes flavicans]
MVSVADELTIMVPSTETSAAKYIDIPFHHIVDIRLVAGGPGSQPTPSPLSSPTVLVLRLLKSATEAYYINESSRLPCDINIAFDERRDAEFIKRAIDSMTIQGTGMKTPWPDQEMTSSSRLLTGQILSQSAVLNNSSGPRAQRSNDTQQASRSQDRHPDHLVNAATRARVLSTHPTELESTSEIGAHGAPRRDRASRVFESSVLMSTEMLNVSQKEQQEPIIENKYNEAAHLIDLTSKSHTAWHTKSHGLENAVELQTHSPNHEGQSSGGDIHKSDTFAASVENEEDLYSATPRPKNTGDDRAEREIHQAVQAMHFPASTISRVPRSKKLSRGMRVDDTEQPSEMQSLALEVVKATSSHKPGRADEAFPDTMQSRGFKRKNGALQRVTPNKKAKLTHTYTGSIGTDGDVDPTTISDTCMNEFDVPTTPPEPKNVMAKSLKSSGMLKGSKNRGKSKDLKRLPKTHDNKSKITKKLQPKAAHKTSIRKIGRAKAVKLQAKATIPGPHEPVLRPKTTRAAAKTAIQKMKAMDEKTDVEEGVSINPALSDSLINEPVGDRGDHQDEGESHLGSPADTPELDDDSIHQHAVETNFEDAVAMMIPEEEDRNYNGQPLDNDTSGRTVPEEDCIVVNVSGRGGIAGETTNESEEQDLGPGQSLPAKQENSVGDAANPGEVALAAVNQHDQESEKLLPMGQVHKRPTTPARLTETLSDALSGALKTYKSVRKESDKGLARMVTTTQQPTDEIATVSKKTVAQPSDPSRMALAPQSNRNAVENPRTELQPDDPVPNIPNTDPVTITSGASEDLEGTNVSNHHRSRATSPHVQGMNQQQKDSELDLRPNAMSTQCKAALSTPLRKMRSVDGLHEGAPKTAQRIAKMETGGSRPSATEISDAKAKVGKDPRRIPNMISFSAKGPRNQGLPAPDISDSGMLQSMQISALGSGQARKRRRDIGLTFEEASDDIEAQDHEHRHLKKARLDLYDGPTEPNVIAPAIIQAKNTTRGVLLEHSSLFVEDLGPRISSQSSRVNENGSPLPYQHLRNAALPENVEGGLNEGHSDSENIPPPLDDDNFTLVQDDNDEFSQLGSPGSVAPRITHKKEARFIRSSNSKRHPSSPNAPSAILTGIEAHEAGPLDLLVNGQSHDFLITSKTQDPFIGAKNGQRTGFLDKLRRAHEGRGEKTKVAGHDTTLKQRPHRHREAVEEDPDKTLVEDTKKPSRRHRRAAPMTTESSETSSSHEQSQSSPSSEEREAAAQRWRDALEPHQHNMLEVLSEISHELVGHLIDAETAVEDVVDDYQRRGNRMIERLAEDVEGELDQYLNDSKVRQNSTTEKMRTLRSKLAKSLKQKPVAEGIAKQVKEKRRVTDEAMKEAMRVCAL